ncbi:putative zinc-binding protein [Labilibaculum sp.]|uniref:putative zinc-binding protein n=1 Tax=Labilibaculum sp. TaxID=2060723 RepID=UPI0035639F4B
MENKEEKCQCGATADNIVMSCSGASDVGLISDKVARALQVAGKRKMSCLAMVGAGIEKSITNFKTKDLLVIDGCPTSCGKKMMEQNGFSNYKHMVISELGLKKGEAPATDENVRMILNEALSM